MNNNKHLLQSERVIIEMQLSNRQSFKSVGRELDKDPTTIAKEVKNHILYKKSGAYGRPFNDCLYRNTCSTSRICGKSGCRNKLCKFCSSTSCTELCPDYQPEICLQLSKPPYICNGSEKRKSCTLEKRLYSASYAHKEYEAWLLCRV